MATDKSIRRMVPMNMHFMTTQSACTSCVSASQHEYSNECAVCFNPEALPGCGLQSLVVCFKTLLFDKKSKSDAETEQANSNHPQL